MGSSSATSANSASPDLPKPDFRPLKPDPRHPELADRTIRLFLIPIFGVIIPHLTGLFGPYGPTTLTHWLGYPWFVLVSFLIWHGNRYLLLLQRRHYDWFDHPFRKVVLLLFANFFYTSPLTVLMLLAWYRAAGFGPDWRAILLCTLMCVICVVFITHAYETVYLIQQRESDLLAVERLQRATAESELQALKSQIDPHFLFNSLNALSWLIRHQPEEAIRFNETLAGIYRYILSHKNRELVLLTEELDFLHHYVSLLRLRFGQAIHLEIDSGGLAPDNWLLPPISLQVLFENAVKHNEFSEDQPLTVHLRLTPDWCEMDNPRKPKDAGRTSSHTGLANLNDRCRLALGLELIIDPSHRFVVRLPIRKVS